MEYKEGMKIIVTDAVKHYVERNDNRDRFNLTLEIGDEWTVEREHTYPNVNCGRPVVELINDKGEWMRLPKDVLETADRIDMMKVKAGDEITIHGIRLVAVKSEDMSCLGCDLDNLAGILHPDEDCTDFCCNCSMSQFLLKRVKKCKKCAES